MKYRPNRGTLKDSMKEVKEFNYLSELKDHLSLSSCYAEMGQPYVVVEVKFDHRCFDDRTGWDTFYVLQRFDGEEDFYVAGMSDGVLED